MTTNNVAEMTPEQLRDELAATKIELMQARKLWSNPATVAQLHVELAQLRRQQAIQVQRCGYCGYRYSAGTNEVNFSVMAEHIKSCPEHPLSKTLTELEQARSELKDLQGANRALARQVADVTDNREFWYEKAQDAEAERDEISENLKRMVELNEWSRSELDRVNQRAEQYAESLGEERDTVHEALDECQVERNYPDGKAMNIRTRIFFLLNRIEIAEAARDRFKDRAELAEAANRILWDKDTERAEALEASNEG